MAEGGPPEQLDRASGGVISFRTAILLYIVLTISACMLLKGRALALGLILIGGLAAKTYVHWLRQRMQS